MIQGKSNVLYFVYKCSIVVTFRVYYLYLCKLYNVSWKNCQDK